MALMVGNTTRASASNDEEGEHSQGSSSIITKIEAKTEEPILYRVVIHNDNYTPMEFVVMVLKKFFRKDETAATRLMLKVHNDGQAICGVFPYEIAETKVSQVLKAAMENEYPLKCTLERDA